MSPTPTITEAPANATSIAFDAAGGGVMSTGGLHAKAGKTMSNMTTGPEYRLDSMTVPYVVDEERRDTRAAQKFRPSPKRNPV
jgi:hypothetical protein